MKENKYSELLRDFLKLQTELKMYKTRDILNTIVMVVSLLFNIALIIYFLRITE